MTKKQSTKNSTGAAGKNDAAIVKTGGEMQLSTIERIGFGETSAVATAEREKALVQAKFLMALNNPRDVDVFRQKILAAVERPLFAEAAIYEKPIGSTTLEGPSIRFADEAIKLFGNVDVTERVFYEDDEVRKVCVTVLDLETNISKSKEIAIRKTVERRRAGADREVVGKRKNTGGQTVYIVKATEDEVFTKESATTAKARRNKELELIPQDIIDECMETARAVRGKRDAQDPSAARKRLADAFLKLGVTAEDLVAFLGHPLSAVKPTELAQLRNIYNALAQGEAEWTDFLSVSDEAGPEEPPERSDKAQAVLDRIKKAREDRGAGTAGGTPTGDSTGSNGASFPDQGRGDKAGPGTDQVDENPEPAGKVVQDPAPPARSAQVEPEGGSPTDEASPEERAKQAILNDHIGGTFLNNPDPYKGNYCSVIVRGEIWPLLGKNLKGGEFIPGTKLGIPDGVVLKKTTPDVAAGWVKMILEAGEKYRPEEGITGLDLIDVEVHLLDKNGVPETRLF